MNTETDVFGKFIGSLKLEALDDGRRMKLLDQYEFLDPDQVSWEVPAGAIVDGASIPRPLWSLIGGPWDQGYRNASVIHDFYCSVRTEEWQSVHLVFYRGMRAKGVAPWKAKVMYGAVYFAGPRWTLMDVHNARLANAQAAQDPGQFGPNLYVWHDDLTKVVYNALVADGKPAASHDHGRIKSLELDLDQLIEEVLRKDPSIEELERSIDIAAEIVPGADGAERSVRIGSDALNKLMVP